MTIVCATDFSEPSTRAMRLCGQLAKKLGDRVALVHIVEPVATSYPELVADARIWEQALRERATADLAKAAAELGADKIAVETHVIAGQTAEMLALFAREQEARLVVMGTHGRGALGRLLLGSVAERTMVACDVPVLVVRDGTDGFSEWASTGRPLRVVVGTDVSASTRAALDWVKALRAVGPVDVTLAHIYWPPGEYSRLGLTGPRELFEPDAETVRVLERDLWNFVGELPGAGKTTLRIRPNWGAPGEALAQEAADQHADLLVLGSHRRGGLQRMWLGSVAQSTVRAASGPVLCVPVVAGKAATTAPVTVPRIVNVLTATDFSELGNAAVRQAYALLSAPGGVVDLVTVYERPLPSPSYAYGAAELAPDLTDERRRELEAALAALVPTDAETRGIRTRCRVIEGTRASEAIVQAANRLGADAICLGSHGRTGIAKALMGSVAADVLHKADRPVFVIRAPKPQ